MSDIDIEKIKAACKILDNANVPSVNRYIYSPILDKPVKIPRSNRKRQVMKYQKAVWGRKK